MDLMIDTERRRNWLLFYFKKEKNEEEQKVNILISGWEFIAGICAVHLMTNDLN